MIASITYRQLDEDEVDLWDLCAHFYYASVETEPTMIDEAVDYRIRQGDLYRKLAAREAPHHIGLYNGGINLSGKTGKPILIVNE